MSSGARVADTMVDPSLTNRCPLLKTTLGQGNSSSSRTVTDQDSDYVPYNNARKGQMTRSACRQCHKRKVKVNTPYKQLRSDHGGKHS